MVILINIILILIGIYIGRYLEREAWNDLIKSDEMLTDTFKVYNSTKNDPKNKIEIK